MKDEDDFDSFEDYLEYLHEVFGSPGGKSEDQTEWEGLTGYAERQEFYAARGLEGDDYDDDGDDD